MVKVKFVPAIPPGGGATVDDSKLALMSDGHPSTASFTVGDEEPTALACIMVLAGFPCSVHMDVGDAWSTKVSLVPLMVKGLAANVSLSASPTLTSTL